MPLTILGGSIMRFLCALVALAFVLGPALGQDDAERERRARALLALAKAEGDVLTAKSLTTARKTADKEDKPLVVFVSRPMDPGAVEDAGGVPAKVEEYAGDKSDKPAEPRVVILTKGSGGPKDADKTAFYIREVLPGNASADAVKKSIRKFLPVSSPVPKVEERPKPLDWSGVMLSPAFAPVRTQ